MFATESTGHLVTGAFADAAAAAEAHRHLCAEGLQPPGTVLQLSPSDGELVDSESGESVEHIIDALDLAPDTPWIVVTGVRDPHDVRTQLQDLGALDTLMRVDPVDRAAQESFPASDPPSWTPGRS